MKQSRSIKGRENTALLYVRLSRDDNLEGDSYSITSQKKLLEKVAKEKGYTNTIVFSDDGISGVTMNRPGFKAMIEAIDMHRGSAVFVKDMSRLGRNYIEVGRLTEEYFPDNDIRLIAVSDAIDTDEGENELTPIRNLFNEWYARDISKKKRVSNKIRGQSGEPLGHRPYGYKNDDNNPKRWVVDEEAAAIVRRIFRMTLDGYGTEQIASKLTEEHVLTPYFYWKSKGINPSGRVPEREPHAWNSSTVINILGKQDYCGDVINFKTYSKSYKNKRRIKNNEEDMVIFKDAHEPIIDRETWELVQSKRGKVRKRKTDDGKRNMFSGLLVCADCGKNLHYHFNQKNHDIKYFNCSNYKGNRGTCETTHYIRVDFLEQVVLGEIRRLTRFATKYEEEFVRAVIGHSQRTIVADIERKKKHLRALINRDREIDKLIERLYEDNVAGKISDERFMKLTKGYETEQAELSQTIKAISDELDAKNDSSMTTDMFMKTVQKYTRARKLTPRMLNELIDHIEVSHAEKVDGKQVQRLTIHYNCVGSLEIPDILPLAAPEVTIKTRKGVAVNYS